MSLRDRENWARASRRAKARSDELSAARDLDNWCEAIESLRETSRHKPFNGRRIGTLVDVGELGQGSGDDVAAPGG
ncbi:MULTISPECIES: hypothetical protein [Streptomyces]|nr:MULTISPECIES: hypothetical protein [Streptomyces]